MRNRGVSLHCAIRIDRWRGEITRSREPERHIWMGRDQGDLDIPVLLEVRHFLDQTAKDPPP